MDELAPPCVFTVLDPTDAAACTAAALDAHDPTAGIVTVHPTPNATDPQTLAHDLLAALGKPVTRLGIERISGNSTAWDAAAAWIAGDRIHRVVVLRAHLLRADCWNHLVNLARAAQTSVVLVCHCHRLPTEHAGYLTGMPHRHTDLTEALAFPHPPVASPPSDDDGTDLPEVPRTEFATFRAEAFRRLSTADFARVDRCYRTGFDTACAWLGHHPDCQTQTPPDHDQWSPGLPYLADAQRRAGVEFLADHLGPLVVQQVITGLLCMAQPQINGRYPHRWNDTFGLRLFLSGLVNSCPSPRHAYTRLRGAQAAFLLHGLLLTPPADPDTLAGPGFSTPGLTPAATARIRSAIAHPVHAAALTAALLTGLSSPLLATARINHAATTLLIPADPTLGTEDGYAVPDHARGILRAARHFVHLRDNAAQQPFLQGAISYSESKLRTAAAACGLSLPNLRGGQIGEFRGDWINATQCWWVGDALHGTRPTGFPLAGTPS